MSPNRNTPFWKNCECVDRALRLVQTCVIRMCLRSRVVRFLRMWKMQGVRKLSIPLHFTWPIWTSLKYVSIYLSFTLSLSRSFVFLSLYVLCTSMAAICKKNYWCECCKWTMYWKQLTEIINADAKEWPQEVLFSLDLRLKFLTVGP